MTEFDYGVGIDFPNEGQHSARRAKIIDAVVVDTDEKKEKKDPLLTKKWWDHFMLRLLAVLVVTAFTVCTLGVLAIPVVMAKFYSPIWLMLYGVYLLILLLFMAQDK